MWTKEKEKRKNGEKAYIYTFVQKRHMEPRHYWCSVYTQTRCRESKWPPFWASCRFHPPETKTERTGGRFFYKKVFFFLLSQHTRHVLGAQKVYGESYITGINFKLLTSKLSLNLFFFILILLALSNLLLGSWWLSIVNRLKMFCVVIYVLYYQYCT